MAHLGGMSASARSARDPSSGRPLEGSRPLSGGPHQERAGEQLTNGQRRVLLYGVAALFLLLLMVGAFFWSRFAEPVFADWLLTAIAGCF